jgi:hypothetical protein
MGVGANCHSDMVMEVMVMMCMQYSVSIGGCKGIEREGVDWGRALKSAPDDLEQLGC